MEVEFEEWISAALQHVCPDRAESIEELAEKISVVGSYVLDLDEANVDIIERKIFEVFPNIDSSEELSLDLMVEYLIVISVSQKCAKKSEFVKIIMAMEKDAQEFLMQIIQEHIVASKNAVSSAPPTPATAATPVQQQQSSSEKRKRAQDDDEEGSKRQCPSCHDNRNSIQKLQAELKSQHEISSAMITKLNYSLSAEATKVVDIEVLMIEKDKQIYTLQQQAEIPKKQAQEFEKLTAVVEEKKRQMNQLQDELDCMKPKALKADQLETMVSKLRDRLEEFNEIKSQLKQEQSSHHETHTKYLQYHDEVNELRKCKNLMEEYRSQLLELQISSEELKMSYQEIEKERNQLKYHLEQVTGHDMKQLQDQSHYLSHQLQLASEEMREQSRYQGIGEGMNEFNSTLVQELNLLKQEKEQMTALLSASSVESLEKLTKENEESKLLITSLQQKLFMTKNTLQETQQQLASTQQTLFVTKTNYATSMEEFKATQGLAEEDRRSGRRRHLENVYLLTTQQETMIKQLKHSQSIAMEELEQRTKQEITYQQQLALQHQLQLDEESMKRKKSERLKKFYESESQRYKLQCQLLSNSSQQDGTSNGLFGITNTNSSNTVAVSNEEMNIMHNQLHNAQTEIAHLKEQLSQQQQQLPVLTTAAAVLIFDENAPPAMTAIPAASTTSQSLKVSASSRIAAARSSLSRPASRVTTQAANASTKALRGTDSASGKGTSMQCFLEQTELNDKRLEQFAREKKELVSRSLEDKKEKNELSQKLLMVDKENESLKKELRKLTLDKERMERQMMKNGIALPPSSSTLTSRSFEKENRMNV